MSTDTPAPALADARTAQDALDPAGLEDALCAAGDYLNSRRTHYGEPPLTGREVGALLGAVALAVWAYTASTAPPAAAGLRDRIAAAARAHTPSTVDLSRWIAEDVMDVVAPVLAARDARIRELEERFGATPATGALRSQILAAVRQTLAEDHQDAYRAGAVTTAVMGQVRPAVNTLAAELADLRAQLAATTNPARAEARLAADARPTGGGR